MMMHGTLLANREPFFYFQPQTLEVLQLVQDCRAAGHTAYYTMDAGPNVKILTDSVSRDTILQTLRERFPTLEIIAARSGPEASVL